jgi:hypothetical protein
VVLLASGDAYQQVMMSASGGVSKSRPLPKKGNKKTNGIFVALFGQRA